MQKRVAMFTTILMLGAAGLVVSQKLGYDSLSSNHLQGQVMPPAPTSTSATSSSSSVSACGSRSFTQCQDLPNAGTLAGCTATQYCGLGFGLTGFICKCKGLSSSTSSTSEPRYCCNTFSPPAPALVCIPVGPSRCGAPGPVTSYDTSDCGGNCPAPGSSSSARTGACCKNRSCSEKSQAECIAGSPADIFSLIPPTCTELATANAAAFSEFCTSSSSSSS